MKIQSIALNIFPRNIHYRKNYRQSLFLNSAFDSFTFSGKKEKIQKETDDIKAVLDKTYKNGDTITLLQVSEKTNGLNISTIRRRISQSEELSLLREQTKACDNVKFSKEEKELFENAIKEMLENAYQNNSKIAIRYIARKIGISYKSTLDIITSDPYCAELWDKVKSREASHKKPQGEIMEEEERLRKVFLEAIENNEKLTHTQIAQRTQVKKGSLTQRIQGNPELSALYEQIKNPSKRISGRSEEEIKETIRQILNNDLSRNKKTGIKDIEESAGISDTLFYRLLNEDNELKTLWKKVQKREYRRYSEKDARDLDDYMYRYFLQKREQGKNTTLREIAQYFEVSESYIAQKIEANPQLKYQWNKIKSGNTAIYSEEEVKEQTKKLIAVLKGFSEISEKTTFEQLEQIMNLSRNTLMNRIKNSATAQALWKKVKSQNHTVFSQKEIQKQINDIQDIILKAMVANKKLSIAQIANITKINRSTLELRIRTDENLHALWVEYLNNIKIGSE